MAMFLSSWQKVLSEQDWASRRCRHAVVSTAVCPWICDPSRDDWKPAQARVPAGRKAAFALKATCSRAAALMLRRAYGAVVDFFFASFHNAVRYLTDHFL
jgi:hypothetical protein